MPLSNLEQTPDRSGALLIMKDFKDKIQRLTASEIQELSFERALRIIEENTNTLGDIEGELFNEIGQLGKHKISVDQLKSLKTTIIEQNRGLKTVMENG